VLAPQGYEARRRLVEFVEGLDGQGMDGQGMDGQGMDGQGMDGQGLDGHGLDGLELYGGAGVGYTMGKQSQTSESPADYESLTAGLRRRLFMLHWAVCTVV
jgi:hypothetical protein